MTIHSPRSSWMHTISPSWNGTRTSAVGISRGLPPSMISASLMLISSHSRRQDLRHRLLHQQPGQHLGKGRALLIRRDRHPGPAGPHGDDLDGPECAAFSKVLARLLVKKAM